MLQRYILLWLVLSSGIAWLWPEFGFSFDPFVTAGGASINRLIVVTMFGVGALLPAAEVNQVFRKWPTVLAGTAVQYVSMPLFAWLIVTVMQPEREIATGILIVGCVPGAMASNVLTLAARGNVSYSVSLTTSATLLSPLVVPLTLWLTMDSRVEYDGWQAVETLVLRVVLPVVAGHLFSRYHAGFRRLAERTASAVANLSILAIIAVAVGLNRAGISQGAGSLMLVLLLLNVMGYLAGYFGGVGFRLPEPKRRALTLEVGMQNAGAGIVLARQLFGDDSAAVIPCIVYTFGCMFTGTVLATLWHWFAPAAESSEPPAQSEIIGQPLN